MRTIAIKDDLFEQATQVAEKSGCPSVEAFITDVIQQSILQYKRSRFSELTDRIGKRREELGITEEEILDDFKRFRAGLTDPRSV